MACLSQFSTWLWILVENPKPYVCSGQGQPDPGAFSSTQSWAPGLGLCALMFRIAECWECRVDSWDISCRRNRHLIRVSAFQVVNIANALLQDFVAKQFTATGSVYRQAKKESKQAVKAVKAAERKLLAHCNSAASAIEAAEAQLLLLLSSSSLSPRLFLMIVKSSQAAAAEAAEAAAAVSQASAELGELQRQAAAMQSLQLGNFNSAFDGAKVKVFNLRVDALEKLKQVPTLHLPFPCKLASASLGPWASIRVILPGIPG